MLIGYARVSTADQDVALQTDALTEAGCEKLPNEPSRPHGSDAANSSTTSSQKNAADTFKTPDTLQAKYITL